MDWADFILKLIGTLVVYGTFRLAQDKGGTEMRGQNFDLYTKAIAEVERLSAKLDIETKRGDEQEESIKQLRRTNNTNTDEIEHLKQENQKANADATEYRKKWEAVQLEARNLVREVKILRAILSKNGLLTPTIEAEIAASLEAPPGSTPPEGTASIAAPPTEPPPTIEAKE